MILAAVTVVTSLPWLCVLRGCAQKLGYRVVKKWAAKEPFGGLASAMNFVNNTPISAQI
jgi:hypothetical protein